MIDGMMGEFYWFPYNLARKLLVEYFVELNLYPLLHLPQTNYYLCRLEHSIPTNFCISNIIFPRENSLLPLSLKPMTSHNTDAKSTFIILSSMTF